METVRCRLCEQKKKRHTRVVASSVATHPLLLAVFQRCDFQPELPKAGSLNSRSMNSRASWSNSAAINFVLLRRQRSSDRNKTQQAPMKRHPPENPISSNRPTSLARPAEQLRQQHLSHQPTETQRPAEICHRVRSACIFPHHKIHPRRPNPMQ